MNARKLKLTLFIFLSFARFNYLEAQSWKPFKFSTFKNAPDELKGCGNSYYLSEKDRKENKIVCLTHFDKALFYINGQPIKLIESAKVTKRGYHIYNWKNYTLITSFDHEYYLMKGTITLKLGNKIIWREKAVGEGGC